MMSRSGRRWTTGTIGALLIAGTLASAQAPGAAVPGASTPGAKPTQPPRDTPAQQNGDQKTPSGRIRGRVLAADSGRAVKRARVFLSAPELPDGRGTLTDDNGLFDFVELPAGRYSLRVSKAGYVSISYGQRRPLQAGTPLQLLDGQQLTSIEMRLPRGSAIAGHLFDESGDPAVGAMVRAMRYDYAQGARQLVAAGSAQTDDQGYYRIWGLNPGEYYVNATVRNFAPFGGRGGGAPVGRGGAAPAFGRGAGFPGGRGAPPPPVDDPEPVGYAPTFYPGVPSVNESRPVTVGLGADALEIDFGLLLVHTSRVAGHVRNSDNTPASSGNINLFPEGTPVARAMNLGSRIEWDGAFSIANVPPGRYTLRARSDDTDPAEFAMQAITVSESDVADAVVIVAPGAVISGTVAFENRSGGRPPDPTQIRLNAPMADFSNLGPNSTARVDKDANFTIRGVPAGEHLIRVQGQPRGWALKSVTVNGREMIDTPIDVRSGRSIDGVTVLFTDRLTEVNGTVTDDHGTPITDYTVLAFPTDASLWRPMARQIMTARPDQNGKYQIRGLPPGDYYLAPVDPAQQGEWFESSFLQQHRPSAANVSLGEGDVKTQDFKVRP
jgi:hypothetical protein